MSKYKLSPWWDENTKPVNRPGVYKTILVDYIGYPLIIGWSYWTGKEWNDTCFSKKKASVCQRGGKQEKRWQGICEG